MRLMVPNLPGYTLTSQGTPYHTHQGIPLTVVHTGVYLSPLYTPGYTSPSCSHPGYTSLLLLPSRVNTFQTFNTRVNTFQTFNARVIPPVCTTVIPSSWGYTGGYER